MVILYKDRNRSLIYDYETGIFKVITMNGKYEIPAELLIESIEEGNVKGTKKYSPLEEERKILFLVFNKVPKREEKLKKYLQKYRAKVVVNDAVKDLDIPGLVSLARKRGLPEERTQVFLSRVIHFLVEKYYRNGDIPSLKSVKRAVELFCEIEKTLLGAKKALKDETEEENHETGNKLTGQITEAMV